VKDNNSVITLKLLNICSSNVRWVPKNIKLEDKYNNTNKSKNTIELAHLKS